MRLSHHWAQYYAVKMMAPCVAVLAALCACAGFEDAVVPPHWLALRLKTDEPQYTARGSGTSRALQATAGDATLAAAPPTLTVSGSCVAGRNAEYALQPELLNGRPYWATTGGEYFIYSQEYSADEVRYDDTQGPRWYLDNREGAHRHDIDRAYVNTAADLPPSQGWQEYCCAGVQHPEYCDGHPSWGSTTITLVGPPSAAGCAALIERTLALPACEGLRQQDAGPGAALADPACSPACAWLWRDATTECDGKGAAAYQVEAAACEAMAAASTVLHEAASIQVRLDHDFTFEAVSGTRYEVRLRASAGSGSSVPCMSNADDDPDIGHGPGTCDNHLLSGFSCARDFCAECVNSHYCDLACGFLCVEDGVTAANLFVLPPGASSLSQAVASNTLVGRTCDKDLSFTSAATGTFAARVAVSSGSGPVTLTVTAVGTALELAPPLQTDGPHPLSISCYLQACSFGYGGAPMTDAIEAATAPCPSCEGTTSPVDLVLPDAEAGRAYAFLVELPPGETAAQVEATFYQEGAAAGAAGFDPVVSGPMGDWTVTPPSGDHFWSTKHESYAEHMGCSNEDSSCTGLADSFGIHPGGETFPRYLKGTWVAPTSGAVLLQLVMNCDVVFFADVQADGCEFRPTPYHDDTDYGCAPTRDGTDNGRCASQLLLTVTPGAYYDDTGRRRLQADGGFPPADDLRFGIAQRTDTIAIGRAGIEAQAAAIWQTSQDSASGGRRLQVDGGSQHPPSLEEMLDESNTLAHEILIDLVSVQQQPSLVYPTTFQLGGHGDSSGGHRRLQKQGDRLTVIVESHAPSPDDADQAVQRLVDKLPGAEWSSDGTCELQPRTQQVNDECCDQVSEDCSSGFPASCNVGCAAVVLPFFDDCAAKLGATAADFDGVVAMCRAALPSGAWNGEAGHRHRRRLQCDGSCGCPPGGCHADNICGLGSTTDECSVSGQTTQPAVLTISTADIEALMREKAEAEALSTGRRLQVDGCSGACGCLHAPSISLAEALVSGSEENGCLASIFNDKQKPLAIEPTDFSLGGKSGNGRRRQLQLGGDQLHVTIDTHAATAADADDGLVRLATRLQASAGPNTVG